MPMQKVNNKVKIMHQKYTRKSTITSVTNTEKIVAENIKSFANDNKFKRSFPEISEKLRKHWDKYVYTLCILFNYLHYVSCSNNFIVP